MKGDPDLNKQEIISDVIHFVKNSPANYITEKNALDTDMIGLQIFQEPLVAFGAAEDKLEEGLRDLDNNKALVKSTTGFNWIVSCV